MTWIHDLAMRSSSCGLNSEERLWDRFTASGGAGVVVVASVVVSLLSSVFVSLLVMAPSSLRWDCFLVWQWQQSLPRKSRPKSMVVGKV